MESLSGTQATSIADALLVLHVGIVAFVVLGTLLILTGGWRAWRWVRNRPFRFVHLGLVLFIALQAWLGRLCPLTVWEQALRNRGGQVTYGQSFIQHWLAQLIFFDAPWWTFVAAYTLFLGLVLAAWWWIRPQRDTR